jgi:hypothetical protein
VTVLDILTLFYLKKEIWDKNVKKSSTVTLGFTSGMRKKNWSQIATTLKNSNIPRHYQMLLLSMGLLWLPVF